MPLLRPALLLLAMAALPACGQRVSSIAPESSPQPGETVDLPALPAHPRPNVILMIGDGMGINHVELARRAVGDPDARLHMDRLPVTGFSRTHSHNGKVTDSAASGTAMSSAVKTRNGSVGMAVDAVDQLTILEGLRRRQGYRTGLVVTKNITDATPAAFAAEVVSRSSEAEIAGQLLAERVDVLFGGGRSWFLPAERGGRRTDGADLVATARAGGAQVATDAAALAALDRLPALGLFADGIMDATDQDQPSLAAMTRKALDLLAAGDAPFFLLVEGSQIDLGGHKNDTAYMVRELLAFDLAVQLVAAFAAARDDTLVLVTADHETGGLIVAAEEARWTTTGHTTAPVPIYAGGAGAAVFAGVLDNTDIGRRLAALTGLRPFPARDEGR